MSLVDWSIYKKATVESFAEGVVEIRHLRGGELWSKRKLRKVTKCSLCQDPLEKGALAYAPITFREYRGDRLCCVCVEGSKP